ncbi:MAG: zinc-binding dehydrogenase [Nitrospinaceae bacterium]|nr:zinc-dependent alcohol dehydrogenase family protein [Nitrospinaceae bacterium]NIW06060.1 zinc-binding dehydrogenase [Nitrospinaceae bacterium]NIW59231.1 zinc-binding dehydrogenase [Nitrospinaceae bacterium]NIX34609.1 zinc-binding dehydrogenase [Nitrospinaceae bacterium]
MKKVMIRQTGGPEVLKIEEGPEPSVGADEVRVEVKAAGLNWSEVMIRSGAWPVEIQNALTPGSEGSGVVEKIGSGVTEIQPGDRVIFLDFRSYWVEEQGSYAEKIVVPQDRLLRFPKNLDFVQAAAAPMAVLTAFDALVNHSPLPESGTVVVTAATGAVGLAALQIARRKGLRVLGTTRSSDKKSGIHAWGVEPVVGKDPQELVQNLSDHLEGEGVDYVFDPINGETATRLLTLLRFNGTFVCYGAFSGEPFTVGQGFLFHQVKAHGYVVLRNLQDPRQMQAAWEEVLPLVETKEIEIPVHKTYPLKDVVRAHREMEQHKHRGKLVLVP